MGTDSTLGSQWKGLPLPSTDFIHAVLEQTDVFAGLCPSTACAEQAQKPQQKSVVKRAERRGRKVVNEEPIPIVLLGSCISKSMSWKFPGSSHCCEYFMQPVMQQQLLSFDAPINLVFSKFISTFLFCVCSCQTSHQTGFSSGFPPSHPKISTWMSGSLWGGTLVHKWTL